MNRVNVILMLAVSTEMTHTIDSDGKDEAVLIRPTAIQ